MGTQRGAARASVGNTDNVELADTEHAEDRRSRVYLGPTILGLKNGTVFKFNAVPDVADLVKKFLVPIDEMVKFEKKLKDPESLLSIYYARIARGEY